MLTQNKKFNAILVAGLFISGAVAFGYACGGDDSQPAVPGQAGGSAGAAGAIGTGGAGTDNAGGTNAGGGGTTSTEGGAGTAGSACTAAGSYDNKLLNLPADGGLPAL